MKAHFLTTDEIRIIRNALDGVIQKRHQGQDLGVLISTEGNHMFFQIEGWTPLEIPLDLKRKSEGL